MVLLDDLKTNYAEVLKKTITFDGGTANAIGDFDGTGNPFTIATVTGTIAVKIFGVCTTNLAGATSTVEVGTSVTTAGLIAQTTGTDIDANEIWHDASPDASVELFSVAVENIVANSEDIIGTVGTANMTAGVIDFFIIWRPLSPGAIVTVS